MLVNIIQVIVSILLICSITRSMLKIINHQTSKKLSSTIGSPDKTGCVKDEDGFILCKEEYTTVNHQDYEKVGEGEQYKRPDPQNECFIHGEKVVCRDPPFSPYNKYYPTYAPEEIKDYPYESKPYFEYPYDMIAQSFNWWG